jgi:general secretion pathway protein A
MYLTYWKLKKHPFGNVPGHDFFFGSSQHEEGLFRMLYAVENRKGAAMLTGAPGAGKTTIVRTLMNRLSPEKFEAYIISNPALDQLDFLRAILVQLGERINGNSKVILLDRLQNRLQQNARQTIHTVLIIDEAHIINRRSIFEELRMLMNMQLNNQFLITLIFTGQAPLLKKIAIIHSLKERISVKHHLDPLDSEQTGQYIRFRLKKAGSEHNFFTTESVDAIFAYSSGLPLRINNLCDRCLLIGLMRNKKQIDKDIVNDAIEDIS